MSLFKCREWWRINCGDAEEFDRGCLCVANIDNDPSGEVKIVTGSFQGTLRIYLPRDRDFRVEDLLLEQKLSDPILQVEAGQFSLAGGISLAVLHPRKLVVYLVTAMGNQEQASFYSLQKAYEHAFERTAACMVYGPFGGVQGRDYICVQSMDGQLCVYEQETFAFSRFLHNFLVPGPLLYLQKTDSFITCNSSYDVECYKYTVLAASSSERQGPSEPDTSAGLTLTKKVQVDWSINLGEPALEIHAARFTRVLTSTQTDVMVLGERHVFALSEMGTIRMQMRLDYSPMSMLPYRARAEDISGGGGHNAIVATHTGSLMLYKDTQLVWAAKCDCVPVAMAVATFGGLQGLSVLLSEDGQLSVNYMGTDPPMNVVGGGEGKELNYEEMDEEHRRLLTIIREATSADVKQEPTDRVTLRGQVPTRLDTVPGSPEDGGARPGKQQRSVTVRLFVSYTGKGSIEGVHITLSVPRPFTCSQDSVVLPTLTGGQRTPVIIPITIYSGTDSLPADNKITVIAAYTTDHGEPRTAHCEMQIPLCLACQVVAPVKNAGYKITLDTTRMPPQLTALFEDVVMQSPYASDLMARSSSANVLTFQYYSGHDVTILVSKTGGRYRLQAGTFEAIWLVAQELCQRLSTYFQGVDAAGEEPFAVSFQEALPLQDFFMLIDNHFAERERCTQLKDQLAKRAHQFRSIQKRLLVRFKDRNPAPLSHLDTLLEGTFQQLNRLGGEVAECQESLRQHATLLACGCQVIIMLIRYRFNLDDESFEMLSSYLSPVVETVGEQGWEECTDASMTHLLRTSLAKNAKEQTAVPQPLAPLKDTTKLKKHISIVCERLARGAKLKAEE
mmetsp:Transcript_22638/g.70294  ORF Transcript_22638/g.70294 Transcript_22638/m.70294 type:complete len:843 (+) Transcript_22638:343-2871(+)